MTVPKSLNVPEVRVRRLGVILTYDHRWLVPMGDQQLKISPSDVVEIVWSEHFSLFPSFFLSFFLSLSLSLSLSLYQRVWLCPKSRYGGFARFWLVTTLFFRVPTVTGCKLWIFVQLAKLLHLYLCLIEQRASDLIQPLVCWDFVSLNGKKTGFHCACVRVCVCVQK